MKRWQTLLIGLVISALALFLAFRTANFGQIFQAFRTARYGFVALALIMTVGLTMIRGLRWSVLTRGHISPVDAFWLFNAGFLFNNVLPARLGEIARATLAGRRPNMHFTSALSSIVVERLFDMVSVLVLVGIVLLGLDLPAWATGGGVAMGGGAIVGIIVLAYAARRPEGALRLGARLMALLPGFTEERARTFLQPFVKGLGGVSNARTFALGMALSVFAWLASGLVGWVLMLAFWKNVPLIMGQLSIAAAGLGIAVPAAPSGVGPFEAAVIGVLTTAGYDADVSRGYAFVLHALNILVTSVIGIIALMREDLSFREVALAAQSLREAPITAPDDAAPSTEAPPS
jgi:uncharacterized protein (TIRG00374 family)